MASGNIVVVTDQNFATMVIGSERPVLVEFWAPWSSPCHIVAPILNELAGETIGKVVVGTLNVDEQPLVPPKYAVTSLPTFIMFKGGRMNDRTMGALPKVALQAFIDRNL